MKIRTKIYFISLSLILIVGLSTLLITRNLATTAIEREISARLTANAQSRAHHIETILDEYKNITLMLSAGNPFRDAVNIKINFNQKIKQVNRRIKSVIQSHKQISRIRILDKNGIIIASSHADIGLDISAQDIFLKGKEEVYLGDLHISRFTQKPVISASAPIMLNGIFSGVTIVNFNTDRLFLITEDRTGLGKTGEIYLVNKDDYMITPSRFLDDVVLKKKIGIEKLKFYCINAEQTSNQEHENIALSYKDYRGINVIGVHLHIHKMDWILLAEIEAEEALAQVDDLTNTILLVLGVLLTFGAILSFFISKNITKPILKLHQGAEEISKGNLNYKISIRAKDEIGQLARMFDDMTSGLKKSKEEIEKHNQELEETVDARTKELNVKIEEIKQQNAAIMNIASDLEYANVNLKTEITERKQAEEALKELQQYARELIEINIDFLVTISSEGKITDVNHATEVVTGYPREKLIGTDFSDYFTDPRKARQGYQQVFREKYVRDYPLEIKHRDGKITHVLYNASVYHDTKGNVVGVFAAARDITERKQAEEALQESEHRFRALFEQSYDAIIVHNLKGEIIDVNSRAAIIIDKDINRIVDMILTKLLDEANNCKLEKDYLENIKNSYCSFETYVKKADGNVIYLDVSSRIVDKKQGIVQGIIRDITERKKAEEKLKETTELLQSIMKSATGEIIVATDPKGIILSWNEGARRLLGYEAEEVIGKESIRVFHTEEYLKSGKIEPNIKKIIATKEPYKEEIMYKAKDGREFTVQQTVNPRFDENGAYIGMLGMARDITKRKQAEEQFKKYTRDLQKAKDIQEENSARLTNLVEELEIAKHKAEEALQEKSDFLARMSHEIRTPMNGVIGMTELCLDTKLDKEQREYLGMVKSSADQLLGIINDVLDFSKIEAGRFELESIDFSLRDTIESAMEPLSIRAHEKEIELITFIDPLVPDKVIGDPGRLNQIIINLIGNAVKFTGEGEVVLRVELESGVFPPQFHFSISDTGIGISKDKHAQIFESFTQEDGSTTRKYGGTGLGTTIAKQLVEMMGGQIQIESPTNDSGVGGPGCTFHFTIPFKMQKDQEIQAVLEPTDMTDKKALIVDDSKTNRHLFKAILENWNLKSSIAANGIQALKALTAANNENNPYDIVLLDVMMPEMGGFEVAKKIQSNGWLDKTAIVMLSSSHQLGELNKARKLGACEFLRKPIQQLALYDAIIKALSRNLVMDEEKDNVKMDNKQIKNSFAKETQQKLNILLAEDNKVNQLLAIKLLTKHGHTVKAVENGKLAVEALKKDNFDVVLMDVQMPVMDGYEATKTIRELENKTGRYIPVIAMTAYAMRGDREKCLKAGMDDYISKPVDSKKLYNVIDAFRKGKREEAQTISKAQSVESAVFNLSEVMNRVDEDSDLFKEIVQIFVESYPESTANIKKAIAERNGNDLNRSAHSLKGMVGNFGAQTAFDIALKLEILGKNDSFEGAEKLFDNLQLEIKKLENELIKHAKAVTL